MNRRNAIRIAGVGAVAAILAPLRRRFGLLATSKKTSDRMPVVFLGHGSPMNALETNEFTRTLTSLGQNLPLPKAILCVSAHWMTQGTWVTHMPNPKTIHDFGGFPQALFDVQYPAPGSPTMADKVRELIHDPKILADDSEWGLDHGTWSVLKHLYPNAEIPVLQLSLDIKRPPEFHFELGKHLNQLRDHGFLIVGSGNIVHNLREISWEKTAKPFDWAVEFDEWTKTKLNERDFSALTNEATKSVSGWLSIPTPDHYYPLLYVAGASEKSDKIRFEYEGIQNASISMRCVSFGRT